MQRKDDNPRPPSLPGAGGDAESQAPSEPQSRKATPTPVSLQDPRLGETLVGRYRLDKLVGKGGMGRVYRATQFPLNRPVAVKILNPEFQEKDPQFVRRFFLEAASAARLSHPNTITVFDYGEAESGELFIAMEFLRGRPLSRVINAEGPFSAERTSHIGMQVCRALREAHSKGIIHRDLKPGNILLLEEGDDPDFVKVLDFGLVKLFNTEGEAGSDDPLTPEPSGELTKAGMFLGSPKYMSPEQIQGVPPDPRTDVYSLGVLMYQMMTCKPPFGGATSVEIIYKHVNEPVPTFRSLGIEEESEMEQIINGCLTKHRDDRFDSMNALLARLKETHRLMTGVSAATETGIEIDVSDLSGARPQVSARPAAEQSLDLPVPPLASNRPQTHSAPSSEPAVDAASVVEVPFTEMGPLDATGSGSPLKAPSGGGTQLARFAPWVAGGAFVLMLGVLSFVFTSGGRPSQSEEAPTITAPERSMDPLVPGDRSTVEVTFISQPSGASVFDATGLSLGRTPLTTKLPKRREGTESSFLFKLKGHAEASRTVRLEGEAVRVRVNLQPSVPGPSEEPSEEDYKDNPY